MTSVPDKTLAWLWSVLQNGYRDPERTYTSAARILAAYPTLSPRTEVYTHDSGASALLLTLSGTLPVAFRGTTYRFPLKVWIPNSYPQEAPMVYVTPGADMVVRPGQHVGVDGRVYHPYLADWPRMWERASVEELLGLLTQVFEREPPVISRAQQAMYQRPIGGPPQQQNGGAPQPPPKQRVGSPSTPMAGDAPPPRPPKPGEESAALPPRTSSRDLQRNGPPLPPLPHERQSSGHYGSPRPQHNGYGTPPRPASQIMPPQDYQNGRSPGPPSLPPQPGQPHRQRQASQYERSPVSPVSPVAGYSELPETKYSRPAPLPPQIQQPAQHNFQQHGSPAPPRNGQYAQYTHNQPQQYQPPQQYAPQPPQPPQSYPQQQPRGPPQYQQTPIPKPQPPPDLLTDPFDIALPTQSSNTRNLPAPPIPPNPEKEHLLHALSETLTAQAQQKVSQNLSFLQPLQAQNAALQQATHKLEMELRQLDQLDAQITSNERILHSSIAECDSIIARTKNKPPPNVDEVLIAPTVVGTQLWNAMADEAGCKEAMYVLQRAVDRGRVGGNEFVRLMRALGRERFLRMVVGRKCAVGLGLETKGPPALQGGSFGMVR